jgi:hypothetical protein
MAELTDYLRKIFPNDYAPNEPQVVFPQPPPNVGEDPYYNWVPPYSLPTQSQNKSSPISFEGAKLCPSIGKRGRKWWLSHNGKVPIPQKSTKRSPKPKEKKTMAQLLAAVENNPDKENIPKDQLYEILRTLINSPR